MANSARKLTVFQVITPLRIGQQLNPVERAVLKLLEAGYSLAVIEKMLEINVSYVIKDLSHKGMLYPDAMFRKGVERETYKQGYIFSNASEKKFYDAWLNDYEEIKCLDIGKASLTKTELPVHYVIEKFKTNYTPVKGVRAQKFTEIGWSVTS